MTTTWKIWLQNFRMYGERHRQNNDEHHKMWELSHWTWSCNPTCGSVFIVLFPAQYLQYLDIYTISRYLDIYTISPQPHFSELKYKKSDFLVSPPPAWPLSAGNELLAWDDELQYPVSTVYMMRPEPPRARKQKSWFSIPNFIQT